MPRAQDREALRKSTTEPSAKDHLSFVAAHLNPKRCPAWCDRVLMDAAALELVNASEPKAKYASFAQHPVITDHNQVGVYFFLP